MPMPKKPPVIKGPPPPSVVPKQPKRPSTAQKMAAHRRGIDAEAHVAKNLQGAGWKIVLIRHKTPYGELDLIAEKPHRLLIVEVKFTHHAGSWHVETTLPNKKQRQRILDATQHFLIESPAYASHGIVFAIAIVRKSGEVRYVYDWLDGAEE